jgi:hypothetical protein
MNGLTEAERVVLASADSVTGLFRPSKPFYYGSAIELDHWTLVVDLEGERQQVASWNVFNNKWDNMTPGAEDFHVPAIWPKGTEKLRAEFSHPEWAAQHVDVHSLRFKPVDDGCLELLDQSGAAVAWMSRGTGEWKRPNGAWFPKITISALVEAFAPVTFAPHHRSRLSPLACRR